MDPGDVRWVLDDVESLPRATSAHGRGVDVEVQRPGGGLRRFATFDVHGEPIEIALEPGTLGFTYCQVPVVYHLAEDPHVRLTLFDGSTLTAAPDTLSRDSSAAIFGRNGAVARIDAWVRPGQ